MAHSIRRLMVWSLLVSLLMCGLADAGHSTTDRSGRVAAFETDTWTVWTAAGVRRLVVNGDGSTDLDCYANNLSGRLLGKDDGRTDRCVVGFTRYGSGNVKIQIVNIGAVWNRYELRVE
jgi:hypothetical protein